MKWIIASDIHGAAEYCKKLLEAYKKERGDKLILLGDILYHGPRNDLPPEYGPKAVIAMLNAVKDNILCVRGNCDAEVDQMVLDFPIMAEYALLPIGDRTVFITHGHKFNANNPPAIKSGDILLHGHTHIPVCEDHGYIYMNPGSTSIPKQGSHHSYMTFDGKTFEWKTLDGDLYNSYSL